jgi:hypothetical protein
MKNRLRDKKSNLTKWVGSIYARIALHPHEYLSQHSNGYRRWHNFRFYKQVHIAIVSLAGLAVVLIIIGGITHNVFAFSSWVQSNWSGGLGSSTTNQYSAASNVTTSTPNQITLSTNSNIFTNNNYSTNLSNWSTGLSPNMISGLAIWLQANSINQSNGSLVSNWADSSGNSNNAVAVNSATLNTTGLNGQPTLTFSGTDYYTITIGSGTPINTNSFSAFIVQKPGNNTTYGMALSSNGTDDEEFDINWPSNGLSATYLSRTIGTPYSFTVGTPLISSLVTTSSTGIPYNNGTAEGSSLPDSVRPTNFHIGNYAFGSGYYYGGSISEIIVYNTTLTNTQRAAVENYLASKYGITVSSGVTATRNTATTYNGATASAMLVTNDAGEFTQNVTTGSGQYQLTGYAYTNGSAVTSANVQLYYNGSTISTTYTPVGGGWYSLTGVVNGIGGSVLAGVQVQSSNTVYLDGMTMTNYLTSGSLTSNIFDTGLQENWGNLTYSATVPANTTVSVLVRAGNQSNLSDAPAFTSCSAISSGSAITSSCAPNKSRYVQYQLQFTSNGTYTPTFTSISMQYSASDIIPPPINASNVETYRSNGGASVASDGWTNTDPYFTWTAGQDNTGGSGILGYCLYLGQDPTGNPITTEGDLGTSPVNTNGACQFAVSTNSVDTSLSGYINIPLTSSTSHYYLNVLAIDNADNIYTGSPAQFEFMFDNIPPTNPAFISAPSEFVSNKQVTLTWPTTGADAASDDNSGVAGLEYRIGAAGTWYGTNHNGYQDATDLLPNNGSYTTISNPDFANLVQGNNIIYFRTWTMLAIFQLLM